MLNRIAKRIEELEKIKNEMDTISIQKRKELAKLEAEDIEVREVVNKNIFENTNESRELEELKIVMRWGSIYNGEGPL